MQEKVHAADDSGRAAPDSRGVLFVPYRDTLGLLSVDDALNVCEQVYLMHARGSVVLSNPPSFKLDVADGFHNHWHVKSVFLKDIPATGVRVYNYFDDGVRNTVGGLGCTRNPPQAPRQSAISRARALNFGSNGSVACMRVRAEAT